jgi:GNAT superfamily N-acetyltransferase
MTSEKYEIRPVAAADRAQWEPLWQGYLQFYESSLPGELTDLLWRRILDPAHEIQGLVAAAGNGNLLGLVHFFPHAHTWYEQRVCYLNDLFVSPELRGGGIGAALIDVVVEAARERGWAEVYWHTQQHNRVARGLYDKITGGTDGFVNYTIALTN